MDTLFKVGIIAAILLVSGLIVVTPESLAPWTLLAMKEVSIFGIEMGIGIFILALVVLAALWSRRK